MVGIALGRLTELRKEEKRKESSAFRFYDLQATGTLALAAKLW